MSIHICQPVSPKEKPNGILNNSRPTTALSGLPELHTIGQGADLEIWTKDSHALLFLLKGEPAVFVGPESGNSQLSGDNVVLLAANLRIRLRAEKGPATLICFYFHPTLHLCLGICPSSGNKKECRRRTEIVHISSLQRETMVNSWLHSVMGYLSEMPTLSEIFELKLRELFCIFRSRYEKPLLDNFLSSFHCQNKGFRAFVFRHHLECRSAEELAAKMNLSLSSFKRHFNQEFGCPPLKWMHEERARHVYTDLADPSLSLKAIAEKNLFSTVSYLCAFCRKMLGNTPLQLRKAMGQQPK